MAKKKKDSELKIDSVMESHDRSMEYDETDIPGVSLSHQEKSQRITRKQIALDTLVRYSGSEHDLFQPFVLLTNFPHYVEEFASINRLPVYTGSLLRVAHCKKMGISMIDYRVGAPMAALVVDVLSYTKPQSVVMLGLCGGLHRKQKIGDFILPMAAIRDEGASRHYMPSQVPSLPALLIQQYISQILLEKNANFSTGVVHTTDYRLWEFNNEFKENLVLEKATAIDMECSALFTVGFAQKVPVGALMLVSDLPLSPRGIKTKESARKVFEKYTHQHLQYGVESLKLMKKASETQAVNFRRYQFL